MARTLTARLQQTNGPKDVRLFELFDRRFLRVRLANARKLLRDYAMDVVILAPSGRLEHSIERRWLWAAGIMALGLLGSVGALNLELGSLLVLLPLAGVLLTLLVLSLALLLRSRRKVLVFDSRFAGIPLVEILVNQPDKKTYKEFVETLTSNIETQIHSRELNDSHLRAGELRTLRKLLEQQIIDSADYDTAKQFLLTETA